MSDPVIRNKLYLLSGDNAITKRTAQRYGLYREINVNDKVCKL